MKLHAKSVIAGVAVAYALPVACLAYLYFTETFQTPWREQTLPSGKKVLVTSFNLTWGDDHGERHFDQDDFAIEFVSPTKLQDETALDAEAKDVFELIRPISEQWGFTKTDVAAISSTARRGKIYNYRYTRAPSGEWSFERTSRNIYANGQ